MNIITNHKSRESVYYPTMDNEKDKAIESAYGGLITLEDSEFVFYRDYPYFIGDCTRTSQFGEYWHGYFSETFFSCVLVHYNDDGTYVFGRAYS